MCSFDSLDSVKGLSSHPHPHPHCRVCVPWCWRFPIRECCFKPLRKRSGRLGRWEGLVALAACIPHVVTEACRLLSTCFFSRCHPALSTCFFSFCLFGLFFVFYIHNPPPPPRLHGTAVQWISVSIHGNYLTCSSETPALPLLQNNRGFFGWGGGVLLQRMKLSGNRKKFMGFLNNTRGSQVDAPYPFWTTSDQ